MTGYRNSKNHVEDVKRYRMKKVTYYFDFDKEKDKDIIEWFNTRPNRTGALRELIRRSLENKRVKRLSSSKLRQDRRSKGLCVDCGQSDSRTEEGLCLCVACWQRRRNYGKREGSV